MYIKRKYILEGSSRKISQLVGDFDRELQFSTSNLTSLNYQIWGTDLGVSFQYKGKTHLLFGDIPGDIDFGSDRAPFSTNIEADIFADKLDYARVLEIIEELNK